MKIATIKDSNYLVTSEGKILSPSHEALPLSMKNGYQVAKITGLTGKVISCKVHRLVAEAFLPNPYKFKYLIHKNKNKLDNSVTNLYWSKTPYPENTNLASKRPSLKKVKTKACPQCQKTFIKTSKRKVFCSVLCGNQNKASYAGRISAQKNKTRSKNEILFANKCLDYFGEDRVLTNQAIFNGWDADVILTHKKIATLWNGKWHYEKIRKGHNLTQVQTRDKIKEKEIKAQGYQVYIIKDLGKFSPQLVEAEFNKLINFINT